MPDPTDIDPGQAIDDLSETVVASRIVHQGHYLTFRVDTIERADGSRAERDVVGHPGAVAILAIDPDDEVLLVRQFRVPAGRVLLEIPAGTLDVDAATGAVEDHALAARRELEEETGYRAATWRHLASFWTAPGFATELMHLWLATDLRAAEGERLGPDEDEHLRLERMPLRDALAATERGEIADAKSILGLLWLDRLQIAPTSSAAAGSLRLTFHLRMGEFLGAMAVLTRQTRGTQIIGLFATALGVLNLVIGGDMLAWLFPLVFGLATLTGVFVIPFGWIAIRRRRELIEEPVEMIVDRTGITRVTTTNQSHIDWQVYVRVREAGDWFFLDTGAGSNFPIPKRAFSPEDLATFRRLVAEAGFGIDGRRKRPTA